MRMPWPAAVGGALVAVVGVVGLVRGAVPLPSAGSGGTSGADPIVVSNAYVRPPAPPTDAAAAYFTVYNTTARPDRLVSAVSGAGEVAVLHTAGMAPDPNGILVPPHGKLVLSTGRGHVMIEKLIGKLRPEQNTNLMLTFARAGVVSVNAKVIALGAPVPKGGSS